MKGIILKFSAFLLIGFLIGCWILFFAPLNLPESIEGTRIKPPGIVLLIVLLSVIIPALRSFLRENQNLSIIMLTLYGALICLIARSIYHLIAGFIIWPESDKNFQSVFETIIGVAAVGALFSFLTALTLKKQKIGIIVTSVFAFIILYFSFCVTI